MLLGVTLPIVVFEVLGYACLSLCIWHALHQGPLRRARLIELGIGVLYGLTLETLTIVQLHVFFFLSMLFVAGIVEHLPALLGISLAMVAVSLVLHGWLVQQKLMMRQLPTSQAALSSETFSVKKPPSL